MGGGMGMFGGMNSMGGEEEVTSTWVLRIMDSTIMERLLV